MSRIDVIVPCYQYGQFLRKCVESVLMQSHKDLRVLIVDDASSDNSYEVAKQIASEDDRVHVIRHKVNAGHIFTYNEGIDWLSGDYYLLLSADDFLLPGALRRAAEVLDLHPEVGFVFGRAIELRPNISIKYTDSFIENIGIKKASARIFSGFKFIEIGGSSNIVPTPTAVIRADLQKRVGGYRPELPHSGDMEMWWRLAAHASVGFLEKPQAVYRIHGKNMSQAYNRQKRFPDLLQRSAAINCFTESCSSVLPDADRIRSRMLRLLSRDAVGYASSAFNDGDFQLSNEFMGLARSLWPSVTHSLPWSKLACKRLMGAKVWQAIYEHIRKEE